MTSISAAAAVPERASQRNTRGEGEEQEAAATTRPSPGHAASAETPPSDRDTAAATSAPKEEEEEEEEEEERRGAEEEAERSHQQIFPSEAPPVTATKAEEGDDDEGEQTQQGAREAHEIQPLWPPRSEESRRGARTEGAEPPRPPPPRPLPPRPPPPRLPPPRPSRRLQSFAAPPVVHVSIALPSRERPIPLTGEAPPACATKDATGTWLGREEEEAKCCEGERLHSLTLPSPAPVAASGGDGENALSKSSPPLAVAIEVTPPTCSPLIRSVEALSPEGADASNARREPRSSPASSSRPRRLWRLWLEAPPPPQNATAVTGAPEPLYSRWGLAVAREAAPPWRGGEGARENDIFFPVNESSERTVIKVEK